MSDPKPFEAVRDYGQQHMGWPEVPDEKPVDHKAEALKAVDILHDWQAREGETNTSLITLAIEAHVQATLYMAEQQRIANLIAFQALTGEKFLRETRAALGLKS